MDERKWYLRTQEETFGPETRATLVDWARLGRIQPGQEVSDDNVIWTKVEDVPFLDMRFSIDIGDGNPRGPFNQAAADALIASGRLPAGARVLETRAPFPPEEEPTAEAEPLAESKPLVRVEVPVEKIVEKEVRVEVPVEKIVEKIVTVVDDTRVKELEGQLTEERARVAALQERFEKSVRDATDREAKLGEQVVALEDELRRLPQAASEIADIQAAMYGLMTGEAGEIESLLAAEKAEAEEFRRRCEARCDRLRERRRELLKRSGANVEQMTRKALVECPEDPRTAQLRRELDELRRADEKRLLDAAARIRELEASVREREDERRRTDAGLKDLTELRRENAALREQLGARERDLLQERERSEQLRQREEASRQAMVARLQQLESPAIGVPVSASANQSREARRVKIPGWMRIGVGK